MSNRNKNRGSKSVVSSDPVNAGALPAIAATLATSVATPVSENSVAEFNQMRNNFVARRTELTNQIAACQAEIDQMNQEIGEISKILQDSPARSPGRPKALGADAQTILAGLTAAGATQGQQFTTKDLAKYLVEGASVVNALKQLVIFGHLQRPDRGIYTFQSQVSVAA